VKSMVFVLRLLWRQWLSEVCSFGIHTFFRRLSSSETSLRQRLESSFSLAWKTLTLLSLVLAGVSLNVSAQTPVGNVDNTTMTPTPGAGHDYIQGLAETVNPANGSVSIRIAAPAPQERGLNLPLYAFLYDTNGAYQWTPIFVSGGSSEYKTLLSEILPVSGPGPSGGSTLTGAGQGYGAPGTLSKSVVSLANGVSHSCTYTTNYVYTDTSGGRHPLSVFYMDSAYNNANSCGYFGVYDNSYSSGGDGTIQATIDPNSPGDVFIYDLHGDQLNPDYKVEDTNGNYLNGSGRSYTGSYVGGSSPTSLTVPGLGAPYTYSYEAGPTQQPTSPFSPNAVGLASNDSLCPTTFTPPTSTGSAGNTVISLPNGQQYTIAYDPNYNLVSKITYPTGATVSYTWINNHQSDSVTYSVAGSDTCSYNYDMPAVYSRIVSYDGSTTALEQDFSYQTNSSTFSKTTTVTTYDRKRGTSFQTIYTYSLVPPYHQPWSPISQGSAVPQENTIAYKDFSGSLLKTDTKVWANLNILSAECTTLPNGQTSGTFYQYQGLTSLVTDKAEYDYGLVSTPCVQPSSTPTRETVTAYQSFATTAINTNILDRPLSVVVKDHGTVIAQTNYYYAPNAVATVSPAANNHDPKYSGSSITLRGNLTSVTRTCLQSCTSPITSYGYDDTGQLVSVTDPCGNTACADMNGSNHTTTYSYTDSYSSSYGTPTGANTNTYVTTVTGPATNGVAHIDRYQYGFNNGKMTLHTDQNSNVTTYCYLTSGCSGSLDPWARLREVSNPPGGGSTVIQYSDSGPNPTTTTSVAMSSTETKTNQSIFDAYGHLLHAKLTSDPAGIDTVDTTYDGLGRSWTVSNPYLSISDPTYGLTTYTYDSLGRILSELHPDQTSLGWSYSNNVMTSTDEVGNSWQSTSDAFGRLTNVIEPTGASTGYIYDGLNNLKTVNQNGAPGDTPRQPRSFFYDSLSRLTSSSNPETGAISYSYDANSNLTSKTDARLIKINYGYDALNRMTAKSASDGSLNYSYTYDGTDRSGVQNPIGRLTHSYNNVNAGSNYDYDAMGRPLDDYVCVPGNCGYGLGTAAGYDLAGNLAGYRSATGMTTGLSYNAAGRLNTVTTTPPGSSTSSTLFSSPTYGAVGLIESTLGNGLREDLAYDKRTRLISYNLGSTSSPTSGGAPPTDWIDWANNGHGISSIPQGGLINAEGWAYDPQDGAPVARVDILIDGTVLGQATLGEYRPDVDNGAYPNCGWTFVGSIGNVTTGSHIITAIAYDWSGNSTLSNYQTITVTQDSPPGGSLDNVEGVTTSGVATNTTTIPAGGLVLVQGWATDPQDKAPVAAVSVLLDGEPIGDAVLGSPRSDIASLYGSAYLDSGYNFTGSIRNASIGNHTISVAAYDSSGNKTIISSGATINVVANPNNMTGNVDGVSSATNGSSNTVSLGGNIFVGGWAAEPDQNPGAPVSRVEIEVDGQFLGLATLGGQRPDVAAATNRPDFLDSEFTFDGPLTNVDPGEHTIGVRMFTASGGSFLIPAFTSSDQILVAGNQPAPPASTIPTKYSYAIDYGPNGNVVDSTDTVNGPWSYTYDNLNRLIVALSPTTGVDWSYDSFGNRWQQTPIRGSAPSPVASFANATNHIDGFCYDAAGDVLDDGACPEYGAHKYAYDGEGKLISSYYGAITYIYDAEGRRIAKANSGTVTNIYYYDVFGNIGTEQIGSNLIDNIYAGSRHLVTLSGGNTYYNHANWLGTESARSDVTGTICQTISSLPFGDAQQINGSCTPSPVFFTSKERDTESGLDYFGARYYASTMGRWMSPDPSNWGVDFYNPQTWNHYSYVGNNPLSNTDPNGLWLTPTHKSIIDNAFPGLSKEQRQILKDASSRVDDDQSQNGSPKHGLTNDGMDDHAIFENPVVATNDFIDQNEHDAKEIQAEWLASGHTGISPAALAAFGNAAHTIADEYSPAHQGFQMITGKVSFGLHLLHELPGVFGFYKKQQQQAAGALQNEFFDTFGSNLGNQATHEKVTVTLIFDPNQKQPNQDQ
jgi:RHS repeat-associated protein